MKIGKIKIGRYPEAPIYITTEKDGRETTAFITDEQAVKLIKELEKRIKK